jgi:hypothetical protein
VKDRSSIFQLFALAVISIFIACFHSMTEARIIPDTNGDYYNSGATNDKWCVGGRIAGNTVKSYSEACLDYTGSLVPTSTLATVVNGQTVGSATTPWNQGFFNGMALTVQTTNQIALDAYPAGSIVTVQERISGTLVSGGYNECQSTAAVAGNFVYIIVATNTANDTVGSKCNS